MGEMENEFEKLLREEVANTCKVIAALNQGGIKKDELLAAIPFLIVLAAESFSDKELKTLLSRLVLAVLEFRRLLKLGVIRLVEANPNSPKYVV